MKRCPARQSQYPCSAQQPPLTEAGEARGESCYCNRPRPGRRTRENGNCGPTRKPPNYPTWSAQRRSRTATKSRRKEARSKVPFAQSPALSDLVRYVHGHTDPESSEEKRTFGSGKETKFQQNACKFEPGAVTGSQKAPRKENECPRRHAEKSKPEKSAPERKRMYNEAKCGKGKRFQNVSKKADILKNCSKVLTYAF